MRYGQNMRGSKAEYSGVADIVWGSAVFFEGVGGV